MIYFTSSTTTGLSLRRTSTNEMTLSSRERNCETLDTDGIDSQSCIHWDRFDVHALSSSYSTLARFKLSRASVRLFLTGVLRLNTPQIYKTQINRKKSVYKNKLLT